MSDWADEKAKSLLGRDTETPLQKNVARALREAYKAGQESWWRMDPPYGARHKYFAEDEYHAGRL